MPAPDKASIEYEGALSPLRFHTVVSEGHTATAQVTKFPVQSGFEISNHVIRKNRTVAIEGIVSNHIIAGQTNDKVYGKDSKRVVFAELKRLVNEAVVCDVFTNLGSYTPVIFTKFTTKTAANNPDALHFTISGEELILAENANKTTPNVLTMVKVVDEKRQAMEDQLDLIGIQVAKNSLLYSAPVTVGDSFVVQTKDFIGKVIDMTYVALGQDPTTGFINYDVHTSLTDVFKALPTPQLDFHALVADGASTVSTCLQEAAAEFAIDTVDETIDTVVGKLTKSVYGAYYETFGVNENETTGQIIASLGADCLVMGALGTGQSATTNGLGVGVPSAADALEGAIRKGGQNVSRNLETTIIKIVGIE